jgi:hypothetical protein
MPAAPPGPPDAALRAGITPTIRLLAFYAMAFFVPVAEFLIVYLHAHIPVVVIADVILTLLLLGTGRIAAFFRSRVGVPWMVMGALLFVAALTGVYPGRSIPFITTYLLRFHVFPLYCCAIALNTKQVRHLILWIGCGSFLLLALSLVFGQITDGRLGLPDTDLANPNDLCLALLLTMGALLVLRGRVARILAVIALPVFMMEVLKTGSRAGLLALLAMILVVFMLVPSRIKIMLAILIPIGGAAIVATVPSFTLSRLTLIVADTGSARVMDNGQLSSAVDSQAARTQLQKQTFELAVRHPLLGVGALNLEDAIDGMIRDLTGKKSGWLGAHNTYLELAGENGFPAALIYIWVLITCFRMNYRSYQVCRNVPNMLEASAQSLALLVMTATFFVCTGFDNDAYSPSVCVLIGLAAANCTAIEREARERAAEAAGAPLRETVREQFAAQLRRPAPRGFANPRWRA